jgi:hypothetical protein
LDLVEIVCRSATDPQIPLVGSGAKCVALAEPHATVACLAKMRRFRKHRLEYGCQLSWRTADDLENISGGGLLLERFS